jgi:hypothetical protein
MWVKPDSHSKSVNLADDCTETRMYVISMLANR